jgi:hypothetical protein
VTKLEGELEDAKENLDLVEERFSRENPDWKMEE